MNISRKNMSKMKNNRIIVKCGVAILSIYAICLTCIVFIFNNNSSPSPKEVVDDSKIKQELQQKIIQYGDTCAYNFLIDNYGSADNLIYSIFMADQYGYPKACHYVYDDIAGILYAYNGIVPDSIVANLTLSCLYKGKDDQTCHIDLGMLYTTGYMVEKDTIKGRYYTEMAFRDEGEEYVDRLMKMYLTNKIFNLPHKNK